MNNKRSFLPIFLLFFFLSVGVFFLPGNRFFQRGFIVSPLFFLQGQLFRIGQIPSTWSVNKNTDALQNENLSLRSQLVIVEELKNDDAALRDQFKTTSIPASTLLPATVIGEPQFLPGVSSPESLVINKGNMDGVEKGDAVVYQTNLLGVVSQVTAHASLVTLTSNPSTSFTAKTAENNAQGVLKGQGNGGMVLGNVLLSDILTIGDTVITNGSQDISGKGIPPGLIVGKIISVSKNPSSLYQSASVESLVHITKLITVFILKQK